MDTIRSGFPHFYEVRFEDILHDPRAEIGRVLEFCELSPVSGDTESFWSKMRRIGVVHHTNRYEDFSTVEEICRDNMEKHGYRLRTWRTASVPPAARAESNGEVDG